MLLGNFRVGGGEGGRGVVLAQCLLLTLRYPVPVPQPAVPPGKGPGHSGQAEEGAALVSTRSRAGAPQFTTAELAMVFTPQAPDPRCK